MIIASCDPVYAQTVDRSVDNVCEQRGFLTNAGIRAVGISERLVDNTENPLDTPYSMQNVCSRRSYCR